MTTEAAEETITVETGQGVQVEEPETQPEPSATEKKFAELRESLETDEGADDKSPGPVRTPKQEEPADEPKAEEKPKTEAEEKPTPKGEESKESDDGETKPEPVVLKLPGRNRGDPDFELPVDPAFLEEQGIDAKTAEERIRQIRNVAERGADLITAREEIAAERAELDELGQALEQDPVGFLTTKITNPKLQEAVATRLLTTLPDDAFDRVVKAVDQYLEKPGERETARLRQEVEDRNRQDELEGNKAARKADIDYAREIGKGIVGVMEDAGLDFDDARGERFYDHAVSTLIRHTEKNKINDLDPSKIPDLLEELGVLEDFGLSREAKPKGKDADKKSAAESKQDPRERDRRRREATTTPAGDGAEAATGERPPKGQSFKERIKWIKEH